MTVLSDELLQKIVTGSGRVYTNEAKAMAAELLKFRQDRDIAARMNMMFYGTAHGPIPAGGLGGKP